MNVADVLTVLVGQAKWGPDTTEQMWNQMEAVNAIDAWAASTMLPAGVVPERPVSAVVPSAVGVAPIDYDQLAAAIVRAQQASGAVTAEPATPAEATPVAETPPASQPAQPAPVMSSPAETITSDPYATPVATSGQG